MKPINLIVLHGVGKQKTGYARDLIKGLKREFIRQIELILDFDFMADINDCIKICEFLWADIVEKEQENLKFILKKDVESMKISLCPIEIFWQIILKGLLWLRANFASQYVSDIIAYGYRNQNVYESIQKRLLESIETFEIFDDQRYITLVAHSLGSVISSDFVYDKQKARIPDKFKLLNFFSFGSPLALYALKYGDPSKTFTQPIHVEVDFGRWVNILDKDDPLAFNLKLLNRQYDYAVLKDLHINTGFFGFSHIKYWKNKTFHRIIARKLALDWLKLNDKLGTEELKKLYGEYDRTVGL